MTPIRIEARDGLELRGYLTRPRAELDERALVVMVHGGPHGIRDYWSYDPVVQRLAAGGYAVLQVNYRGSGGFGRRFTEAGFGEWGLAVQNDIADAVLWAAEQNVYDGDRVCIYGASFGGYSAMMSLARFPDLYRCGISYAGVSDLEGMVQHARDEDDLVMLRWLSEVLRLDEPGLLATSSPISHVANIRKPMLIGHGVKDIVVPYEQSRSFTKKLARHDKEFRDIFYLHEGHSFTAPQNRLHFLDEAMAFLDLHLLENTGELAQASDESIQWLEGYWGYEHRKKPCSAGTRARFTFSDDRSKMFIYADEFTNMGDARHRRTNVEHDVVDDRDGVLHLRAWGEGEYADGAPLTWKVSRIDDDSFCWLPDTPDGNCGVTMIRCD